MPKAKTPPAKASPKAKAAAKAKTTPNAASPRIKSEVVEIDVSSEEPVPRPDSLGTELSSGSDEHKPTKKRAFQQKVVGKINDLKKRVKRDKQTSAQESLPDLPPEPAPKKSSWGRRAPGQPKGK